MLHGMRSYTPPVSLTEFYVNSLASCNANVHLIMMPLVHVLCVLQGVMAFATFLAQLFKHEKDLCWLVSMGELVKGKVTNVEWKDIVACTMYKLTLKVSVAEQFVENMLRNTPGASGLPIHVRFNL